MLRARRRQAALLLAVLALAQQPLAHAAAKQCDPSQGCNVCSACCESYIPDGADCDACVAKQCNATTTTTPAPPTTPAPTPEKRDARYYLRYLGLVLVPFVLRCLQAAAENRVGGCVKKRCCGGKDPLKEALTPSDASNIGNNDTGMDQIGQGKLDGWAGWRELRDKLGWNHCLAVCVSLVRLFLWHLMQPAVYASVLFYYEPQIDRVQFHLGVAVLAREASYVLLILYALCTRPAFLLVNLDSHRAGKGRMGQKILYVLCPEKFVAYAALPATPGLVFRYLLLPLDCCALGGVCLHDGDLPAPLAASYIITALAFLVFIGAAIIWAEQQAQGDVSAEDTGMINSGIAPVPAGAGTAGRWQTSSRALARRHSCVL